MEENSLAAILATKRSGQVLHRGESWAMSNMYISNKSVNKATHSGEEMSPEVKNRGISGPTKRAYVLSKFLIAC